ncbi:hypothetical protein [Cohnella abietis]|uniref:Uncharacterized protein n=1 Tax=Cohnella abietis TaxID=2507935 RepID=A0A3T1D7G5_9BACL|nr:hypothetical protein [Cohnella abietis]BBI34014.1 hypothetical protein KCTCHS21_34130 [Cohnella abietis]
MRNKIIILNIMVTLALVIGITAVSHYVNQYQIKNDTTHIQSRLNDWLNRGNNSNVNPHVLQVIQLDKSTTYIALFQIENEIVGYAELIKGFNHKLKLKSSSYGPNISYKDIKTNKGIYGVLVGKNSNLQIDHISTSLSEQDYSFISTVVNEKQFVKYEKLPQHLSKTYPAVITLYDEKNNLLINPEL